jgi:hypothetical protein
MFTIDTRKQVRKGVRTLQVLWTGISGHGYTWEPIEHQRGEQQRPPCLPFGLFVAALEAKRAARKDSLASQARSRGDGDDDVMDNEFLAAYTIRKSRYVWDFYRSSLIIVNTRASTPSVG